MTPEVLIALGKVNLAAGAAILAVMVLRKPVRALFGARLAYVIWLAVPLAAPASLAPARTIAIAPAAPVVSQRAEPSGGSQASTLPATQVTANSLSPTISHSGAIAAPSQVRRDANPWTALTALWVLGAILTVAWLLSKQRLFLKAIGQGQAGPAVVGMVRPRIVLPADFTQRYTSREQAVILAHERAHLVRQDARANGLVTLVRCLCWFNPLIHIAAFLMRIDQELACDAQVLEAHPRARHTYAVAMLKAEGADRPLPLGCYWPGGDQHPLTERIAMLKLKAPTPRRRLAGSASLCLGFTALAVTAWAAQPARTVAAAPLRLAFADTALAAPPADPLASLAADVSVIFDVGSPHPRLMLQETDHGVFNSEVLNLGDEYRDGWKLSAITDKTVTLVKDKQSRTVVLTGRTQVVSSPKAAASATLPGGVVNTSPARALADAIASGKVGDIIKAGGTALDVAKVIAAGGAHPGGAPLDVSTAQFIQGDGGKVGIFIVSPTGGTFVAFGADYNNYIPPGGIGTLPSVFEAVANTHIQPSPATVAAAPTLADAIAAGNVGQVIRSGGTASDVASAYVAGNITVNGEAIDPSTAVFTRTAGSLPAVGITVTTASGGRLLLVGSDFQGYPPSSPQNLPTPEQIFGLPPMVPLYAPTLVIGPAGG